LLADQRIEKLPLPDAANRCIDSLDLVAEQLERASITNRRATVKLQGSVRMRYTNNNCLNCGIRRLTIHQDVPRHERAVILLGRGLSPACPQQSLVRERSLEMDAVQCLPGPLKIARFEQHGAQHQVRLVADRETGGIIGRQLPGLLQLLDRFLWSTLLPQRDAKAVGNKPGQAPIALYLREHINSPARLAWRH